MSEESELLRRLTDGLRDLTTESHKTVMVQLNAAELAMILKALRITTASGNSKN